MRRSLIILRINNTAYRESGKQIVLILLVHIPSFLSGCSVFLLFSFLYFFQVFMLLFPLNRKRPSTLILDTNRSMMLILQPTLVKISRYPPPQDEEEAQKHFRCVCFCCWGESCLQWRHLNIHLLLFTSYNLCFPEITFLTSLSPYVDENEIETC